jgi:tripartite ATP-independent transporter DctP family solute receptor
MLNNTHRTVSQVTKPQRRRFLKAAGGGLAAILASGRAPLFAQAKTTKLVFAHNAAAPEAGAVVFEWFSQELNRRAKGDMEVQFFGGTLISKEIEIVNAVKTGSVTMGSASGASATITPEFGVFIVPYLVPNYKTAYAMFNGKIGERFDGLFQKKYGLKVLFFYDNGYRHFWNNKRALVQPSDLRGLKLRAQPGRIFADAINGLGGNAVPLPFSELVTAAQQGVIDGGDMPIANFVPVKLYEVSKYASMSYHVYSPSYIVFNPQIWSGLTDAQRKLLTEVGRDTQDRMRQTMGSVDSLEGAKKLLEPHGMAVNQVDVEAFQKTAKANIWPKYQKEYADMWDEISTFKA